MSVITKIQRSDAVIWLDEVQYSHGGWSNRNRMPDKSWLTVPVERSTNMAPFNRVRISDGRDWRRKHCLTLIRHYGEDAVGEICEEILRPYRLLIGLNLAILRIVLDGTVGGWHFQSHLDGGRAVKAISDDRVELLPISARLAMMVSEVGGTTYLSGPSGRNYLDETPFYDLGIEVEYFSWGGSNECSVSLLAGSHYR